MVLRINPSKAILWRTTSEVQFGSGPDALKIANITAAQERLLGLLSRGIADDYFDEVAAAVAAENPAALLQSLDSVLLREPSYPTMLSAEFIEARFAEICRAQAIHSHEGSAVLARRQAQTVFVQAVKVESKLVVSSLEQAAIGSVTCKAEDLNGSKVDFAVLLSNNTVAPNDYSRLMSQGIAHISVVFDSDGVTVSPVIEIGKTPCLSCFHENQKAADECWPAVASQLLFSSQRFDDSVASLFAAAIVCQRTLQFCDQLADFEPAEVNRTGYKMSLSSGQISEVKWSFSSACACRIV